MAWYGMVFVLCDRPGECSSEKSQVNIVCLSMLLYMNVVPRSTGNTTSGTEN